MMIQILHDTIYIYIHVYIYVYCDTVTPSALSISRYTKSCKISIINRRRALEVSGLARST